MNHILGAYRFLKEEDILLLKRRYPGCIPTSQTTSFEKSMSTQDLIDFLEDGSNYAPGVSVDNIFWGWDWYDIDEENKIDEEKFFVNCILFANIIPIPAPQYGTHGNPRYNSESK